MNDRDRFIATMQYQPRDRSPMMDFSFWEETLVTWHAEGLPRSVNLSNADEYFGMDGLERFDVGGQGSSTFAKKAIIPDERGGVSVGLYPAFEEKVIEDRGDHEVLQQADGVRVLRRKFMSSIPSHEAHLLTDRDSWNKHYKPRLDPDDRGRYPPEGSAFVQCWSEPGRDFILYLPGGSLFGWIRNWMGVENAALLVYDDPAWLEEMVTTIADCITGVLTRVLATGGRFEACGMWEDICFNTGPLLPPKQFERFLVPHYRRITDLLRSHGVDVVWVDCDGKIDELIPLWLDAGVNCMMPVEIGTWGADPVRYRKEYGRDLLMMGGFDKHILARTESEIEQEIDRLTPLVEDGGYIGFCDHRVPPDVPLGNYMFYLETVRERWGNGTDLKPMSTRRLPA